MTTSPHTKNVDRGLADINESRNERQKCVLLCELGRHLRHISQTLVAETQNLRHQFVAGRKSERDS